MDRQRELSLLGYAGLIPFFGGAAASCVDDGPHVQLGTTIVLLYGAVIASYMAGMGAGALVTTNPPVRRSLLPGMIAALVAWGAIVPTGFGRSGDASGVAGLGALMVVFGYLLARDLAAVREGSLPDWYAPLRRRLTAGASASLVVVMFRILTT